MTATHRLLLVHAHPDDETINNAVTMARYQKEGVAVTLVTCTRGEEGEVLVPELEYLAAAHTDQLGPHREIELANAMKQLHITDHRFLGHPDRQWRDSGMMGTESNNRPECFWQADVEEAARYLVKIIREIRPQVLITYDDFGGYGHPDHIQAHRVAMRATELAALSDGSGVDPWQISKIYWNIMPRSILVAMKEKMEELGMNSPFEGDIEDLPFVKPDELVTAVIKGSDFIAQKVAAIREYPTQIKPDDEFFSFLGNPAMSMWDDEYYRLVHGVAAQPFDDKGRELDLFAGIDD